MGLQSTGKPFVDWATAFRRTSVRIRERYEPRFPTTASHRLRHSMAMATLEQLIKGFYRQAATLVADTGDDAGMALYLMKSEPMLVLRDLLGHQSVVSTELYVNPRELHQTGEKPQVTWSRRETEGVRALYELAS
ncbi:hypothetical protein ACFV2U_53360 [Streptomyces sp. NPDC059697]|uniref:hypothetical protein n=1 Tax=Streptomyces sp. NPDC059697 TaxID=3346912 RepID=UPI00367A8245